MIDKLTKKQCTGCAVCHDNCPVQAISMVRDREGFDYPLIDHEVCIECNLCEEQCPSMQEGASFNPVEGEPLVCFAAQYQNMAVRFNSTSGGLFTALAEEVYRRGGYVGGAVRLAPNSNEVEHFISNNPEDLQRLRQSKYTQSRTQGFYAKVRSLLQAGEWVLVCGTPCQMAGLRSYLGRDYDKLFILDFICNNVMSPQVGAAINRSLEKNFGAAITSFKAKDKELGWKERPHRYDLADGRTIYQSIAQGNLADQVYHTHAGARPCCYSCVFKGFPRYADISLSDFWLSDKYHPSLDDDTGTSAVMCNTPKGVGLFESIKEGLLWEPSKLDWVLEGNQSLVKITEEPDCDREAFFDDVLAGLHLPEVLQKHFATAKPATKRSLLSRLKWRVKYALGIAKEVRRVCGLTPRALCQFVKYNFLCSSIKRKPFAGAFLYPYAHSVLQIEAGARVQLDAPLFVGEKRLRGSRVESRLLVETGAKLSVTGAFRLSYGGDVEVFSGAHLELGGGYATYGLTLICCEHIRLDGGCILGRQVSIRDTNAPIMATSRYPVT